MVPVCNLITPLVMYRVGILASISGTAGDSPHCKNIIADRLAKSYSSGKKCCKKSRRTQWDRGKCSRTEMGSALPSGSTQLLYQYGAQSVSDMRTHRIVPEHDVTAGCCAWPTAFKIMQYGGPSCQCCEYGCGFVKKETCYALTGTVYWSLKYLRSSSDRLEQTPSPRGKPGFPAIAQPVPWRPGTLR